MSAFPYLRKLLIAAVCTVVGSLVFFTISGSVDIEQRLDTHTGEVKSSIRLQMDAEFGMRKGEQVKPKNRQ
jgi:hypothetical protein